MRVTWVCGLWMLAAACAQAADGGGASIYTCVDATGRRITSDRPIAACIDRQQRELSPSGSTRRIIGPTLTQHERVKLAATERKAQEDRERAADERRRDRMLVTRYPNQLSHDAERASTLELADSQIQLIRQRQRDLQQQRKTLNQEMEFYQSDPSRAPAKLRRALEDNEAQTAGQQRNLLTQMNEKQRINDRFDLELAQLRALWAERQTVVPGLAPGLEVPLN